MLKITNSNKEKMKILIVQEKQEKLKLIEKYNEDTEWVQEMIDEKMNIHNKKRKNEFHKNSK